jgi:hypothetical protein
MAFVTPTWKRTGGLIRGEADKKNNSRNVVSLELELDIGIGIGIGIDIDICGQVFSFSQFDNLIIALLNGTHHPFQKTMYVYLHWQRLIS